MASCHCIMLAWEVCSIEYVRLLMEMDRRTLLRGTSAGAGQTPLRMAYHSRTRLTVKAKRFLRTQQDIDALAVREAFRFVVEGQLELPNLVVANIWQFAKPWLTLDQQIELM